MILSGLLAARPGTAAYHADAVHFDGATWLSTVALTATDNLDFSFAVWVNVNNTNPFSIIYVSDPEGQYTNSFYAHVADDDTYFNIGFWNGDYNQIHAESNVPAYGVGWKFYIGIGQNNTLIKLYCGDVDVTSEIGQDGASVSNSVNGLAFYVGCDLQDGDQFTGDMALPWIAPGVSLLDGGGDIPLATRRKFINGSGKPVYLGANGELPTGVAPAVFLSGNAASFGTNQGTGGSFVTTGTLTNASTSPSD